jgi:hypothetical protein
MHIIAECVILFVYIADLIIVAAIINGRIYVFAGQAEAVAV